MKYVLDSNVALKWVLPEPDSLTWDAVYFSRAPRGRSS